MSHAEFCRVGRALRLRAKPRSYTTQAVEENKPMNTQLDPLISEFETQEQADSYDLWFRERIRRSLDDPRPSIPHDDVMAEMRTLIESKKRLHAAG